MGDQRATLPEMLEGTDPDAEALAWLNRHIKPGQWPDIAKALKLVQEHGGFGKVILVVRDGRIADHPKAELSL